MRRAPIRLTTLFLLTLVVTQGSAFAQKAEPNSVPIRASGTLNIILANKNGFVIAADSRMSSDKPFQCASTGRLQLYCDNSQKLFRTSPHSVLVIAGFAVDRGPSPLDLAIAPFLLKKFGPNGLATDDQAEFAPERIKDYLSEALRNVSALHYPFDPEHFEPQRLFVTFARIDRNSRTVLRRFVYTERLKMLAPLNVNVPEFDVQDSGEVLVTTFFQNPFVGLPYVAQAIFDGYWKSTDPDILNYYKKKEHGQLESMSLTEMRKLAAAMLRETRNRVDRVGGGDQVAVFPASGSDADFTLPRLLPTAAQSVPSVLSFAGLNCSTTPCNGPISFSTDPERLQGTYNKFFLASQFVNIPIALEDNIFIGNKFDGVTFIWSGGKPFMRQNQISNCTIEVRPATPLPNTLGLQACRVLTKPVLDYSLDMVGAKAIFHLGQGVMIQPTP
jgi:20S proteasome alpha/beta subunit